MTPPSFRSIGNKMRPLRAAVWLLLVWPAAFTRGLEITGGEACHTGKEAFRRVSEYFTGEEAAGRRLILRSRPEARAGLYIRAELDRDIAALPRGSKVTLKIVSHLSCDPLVHTFPVPDERPRSRRLLAGLTGRDWPGPDAEVLAWKLTITSAAGDPVAEKSSFLWEEIPAAKQ